MSWFLLPNENPTLGSNVSATQLTLANELVSFAETRGKPVMICEAAPQGYQIDVKTNCNISSIYDGITAQGCVSKSSSAIYQEWFTTLFNFISTNTSVRALSYINADWDNQFLWSAANGNYASGYWGDSRIESDATIRDNWIDSIANPDNDFLQTEDATVIIGTLSVSDFNVDAKRVLIYPNPSKGVFNLKGVESNFSYILYSIYGKELMQGKGNVINISSFPTGVYGMSNFIGTNLCD